VKDTPDKIQRKYRSMLLKRSGEERLKMGCSMHAAARALFLRFYGGEFEPKERKKILLAVPNAVEHKGKQRPKVKEEAQKIFRS